MKYTIREFSNVPNVAVEDDAGRQICTATTKYDAEQIAIALTLHGDLALNKARQTVIDEARRLRDKGLGDGKALVAFGKALQTLDTLEGID